MLEPVAKLRNPTILPLASLRSVSNAACAAAVAVAHDIDQRLMWNNYVMHMHQQIQQTAIKLFKIKSEARSRGIVCEQGLGDHA